jgi:aspartyl-tRNA(Asn)/glutamyl-tRNA(Gln) amidotransferase subunit A
MATAKAAAAAGAHVRAITAINEAVATHNERLRAFVRTTPATALAEAEAADRRAAAGAPPRALEGLAVAIKDIIDVAGLPTQAGSLTRKDVGPATADAHVVTRLRAAGAIVPGKTHTVEYAFGGWGTNLTVGTPWNPWDVKTHRTPGGSSSGSGVAVGAGLLPAALGTDTGGSVRLPAAFCGCVGLKTSIGLVSRAGVVPLAESFDTIGPMAWDVATAARMLAVMQGEDPDDATTVGVVRRSPINGLTRGVKGLRLARLADADMPLATADMRAAFDVAVRRFVELGATVVPFKLPAPLADITRHCGDLMSIEAYTHHRRFVDDPTSSLHVNIRNRMAPGGKALAADWLAMRRAWKQEGVRFLEHLDGFDALLLPTTPFTAPPVAAVDEALSPGAHTRFVNYLELCGLSVPMSVAPDGLPTGLQIVCRRLDDPLALRIGYAFEQARGPFPLAPMGVR